MSGTSLDGLDCCYVDLNISSRHDLSFKVIDSKYFPYNNNLISNINKAILDKNLINETDNQLGKFFLECSKKIVNCLVYEK